MYGHPVYFAETFIDPGRFRGTCYRAANWKVLGLTTGRGKNDHTYKPNRPIKEVLGLPLTPRFRELLQGGPHEGTGTGGRPGWMFRGEELEALLERGRQEPLREDGYQKLLAAIRTLHYVTELLEKKETTLKALRDLLCPATTEKTDQVLKQAGLDTGEKKPENSSTKPKRAPAGHGRNGAAAYRGADKIQVPHACLEPGDACPDGCGGKVYLQREPGVLVRLIGQAPLDATVYQLEKLRCNLCGDFHGGAARWREKYDETVSMMAVLRYGTGVP